MPEIHGLGENGESASHNREIAFARKRTVKRRGRDL